MGPTIEQCRTALKSANTKRRLQSVLKREIQTGERDLLDVLRDPDWFVLEMEAHDLLRNGRRVGVAKMTKAFKQAHVWPLRTVGNLTERERRELARILGES